jgi:hypothetical protein
MMVREWLEIRGVVVIVKVVGSEYLVLFRQFGEFLAKVFALLRCNLRSLDT